MTSTMFNVQSSEEFRDIIVGINSDNSELQVYHKNSGIVYKTKVNIWNPLLRYDSWINYYLSNDVIIISDYNGIYLYNNRYNNVYAFECEKNGNNELICIKYWSIHNALSQYLEFTNCIGIDESKIFKYYFT